MKSIKALFHKLFWRFFSTESLVDEKHRLGPLPGEKEAYRNVTRIALPSVTEMVLASLISSADTVMVGMLGKNAIAGVSLPTQPRMISLAMFFALNVGVTAIVARRRGEERRDAANTTLRNALMLILGLSVMVMILSVAFAGPLMRLAGGNTRTMDDAIVLADAMIYFKIMSYGLPLHAISMAISAAMRGVGNTKLTMRVNITSNLVNLLFNFLLIGGNLGFPRLEVAGAAIASVIGIGTGTAMALYAVVHNSESYLNISRHADWRIHPETMRGIFKVGGNAMVEQISMRIGFFMYGRIIYGMGVAAFAAHNIAMQMLSLTFNFADGLAVAGTSLVGQSLGALRSDLAVLYGKITQRLSLVFSVTIAFAVVLLRYPIAGLFIDNSTPGAEQVIAMAAQTLLVVAFLQPAQMNTVVLTGALRGAGDNLYVASVMLVCVSVLRPLMAVIAVNVLHWDLQLTWLFSLSEMFIRLFFFHRRFESGKWKTKKV